MTDVTVLPNFLYDYNSKQGAFQNHCKDAINLYIQRNLPAI